MRPGRLAPRTAGRLRRNAPARQWRTGRGVCGAREERALTVGAICSSALEARGPICLREAQAVRPGRLAPRMAGRTWERGWSADTRPRDRTAEGRCGRAATRPRGHEATRPRGRTAATPPRRSPTPHRSTTPLDNTYYARGHNSYCLVVVVVVVVVVLSRSPSPSPSPSPSSSSSSSSSCRRRRRRPPSAALSWSGRWKSGRGPGHRVLFPERYGRYGVLRVVLVMTAELDRSERRPPKKRRKKK